MARPQRRQPRPEPEEREPAPDEIEEYDSDAQATVERVRPVEEELPRRSEAPVREEWRREPRGEAAPPRETSVPRERVVWRDRMAEPPGEPRQEPAWRAEAPPPARSRAPELWGRVLSGVDYLFYVLYGLLTIRLVLGLMGAAEGTGFVRFIHGITNPFYAPFQGIVARPSVDGGYLDFPLVIAILAYVLLHIAVRGLIRVIQGRAI